MPLDPKIAKDVDAAVEQESAALSRLATDIHQNQELRFEEHKAAAWISELLAARGFQVFYRTAELPGAGFAVMGVRVALDVDAEPPTRAR